MNQNMHNWIAMVLGVLTVKFITYWHNFKKKENQVDLIIFIVDLTSTLMFLVFWFYYTN